MTITTDRPRRRRNYAIIAFAFLANIYSAAAAGVLRDASSSSSPQPQTSIGTTTTERLLHSRIISPTCFIVGGTRCCRRSGRFGGWRSLQIYSQDASRTSVTRSNVVSFDRDQREFFIADAQFVRKCIQSECKQSDILFICG